MEISGKVLREVEFRDRLRGYDTDEVDEFLENVAIAVDELHEQIATLRQRQPSQPAAPAPDMPTFDDDAIKRTLILAQRTADLAIKEANEEATQLLEEAQREASDLVAQAEERARRVREETDAAYEQQVAHQLSERERLYREVRGLEELVDTERERLSESLQAVLSYVGQHLTVTPLSDEMRTAAVPTASVPERTTARPPLFDDADEVDLGLPDIEREISEDAEIAFVAPISGPPTQAAESDLDPDEELWKRWAQSSDLDDDAGSDPKNDLFGFDRPAKED